MADFVAVIRRAVDGLSDNTPEMRVKVYARARGAVQRQLESMKPQPPETMLQRQMEKLEAAIRDVEAEHAEAAAPVGDVSGDAEELHVAPVESSPPPEPVYEQPTAIVDEAPAAAEPEHVHHVEETAVVESPSDPVETSRAQEEWRVEAEPADTVQRAPAYHPAAVEPLVEAPEASVVEPVEATWHQSPRMDLASSIDEVHRQLNETVPEVDAGASADHYITETHSDPVHADNAAHFGDVWAEAAAPEVDARGEPDPAWQVPTALDHSAPTAIPVHYPPDAGFVAAEQPGTRMPEAGDAFAWEAATFDDLPPVTSAVAAPARPVLPTPAGDYDDVDLFSDVHGNTAKPAVKATQSDGWNELKELAGYEKFAAETDFETPVPPEFGEVRGAGLQGKSYRMEPKRRRFGVVGILLTLIGVAVVGGAGYAAWLNRASLNNMVTGLVSSATKNAAVADKSATPANQTAATTPASTKPATAAQPSAASTNTAAPDSDGNTVNTKFTQRLMADGTEVDAGVPPVPGGPVAAEGKSIAQQNVAAATPPPAAGAPASAAAPVAPAPVASAAPAAAAPVTPPAAAPAATATVPSATPPAATQTATVGTPEKMFLYEERLGQTSPTAIEGSVTWSVQEDKGDDGKPSPTIQGSISVPERGMTALITFKRNTDPSLPASHLIEIVFSLPPNFEGGAIDSVQRVAMKATEQDRGDPLVAVPAKITDDFHMVALNDFPDARKTNMDLLRSRNWIDIPVTYRNGRRALLTMDKGQTGTDAFNKVIGEWAAIGGTASSQ